MTFSVTGAPVAMNAISWNVYFAVKMIRADGSAVVHDRLGSVMARSEIAGGGVSRFDYFPYGGEMGAGSAENRDKCGTYSRDETTGLDYADQRYSVSLSGRFLSSDPDEASGGTSQPSSWNRYPYVGGDPVNAIDPSGRPVRARPVAGFGALMMQLGEDLDVDPRLMVGVSFVESKFGGEASATSRNNGFGVMIPGTQTLRAYSSWEASAGDAALTLARQISRGNDSVSELYSGQVDAYCYGAGCSAKINIISKHLAKMGGNPNSLRCPCHKNAAGRLVKNK